MQQNLCDLFRLVAMLTAMPNPADKKIHQIGNRPHTIQSERKNYCTVYFKIADT